MFRNKVSRSFLILVACLFLSIPATAKATIIDLTVDGGWYEFEKFGRPAGSMWTEQFSFSLLTPGILTVTEAFFSDDRFEVFSNGVSLGETSMHSEPDKKYYTEDYDLAASSPRWSTGIWNLVPGEYLISGKSIAGVHWETGGIRVDSAPVPVPAAAWLLGSAFVGVLGLRRVRKN